MGGQWKDGSAREARQQINYTTVNISLRRDNKPTTIEFRHQKGTLDPDIIKHWVRFCGTMLQTAYVYAKNDFEFRNGPEAENWDEHSFLSRFISGAASNGEAGEILDVINMPDDSTMFLTGQKLKHSKTDDGIANHNVRLIQDLVIHFRRRGLLVDKKRTGELMDAEIEVSLLKDDRILLCRV
jgi:hypothetical protein